jgi:hypothetical protein
LDVGALVHGRAAGHPQQSQALHRAVTVLGVPVARAASAVKLVGAGVDELTFAEGLSRLVGEHDVPTFRRSSARGGGTSRTTRKEQRILPADQVRALPKFTAVLLVTGIRPARIRLVPWMAGPHAEMIRSTGAVGG